jgi:hypothetical protein
VTGRNSRNARGDFGVEDRAISSAGAVKGATPSAPTDVHRRSHQRRRTAQLHQTAPPHYRRATRRRRSSPRVPRGKGSRARVVTRSRRRARPRRPPWSAAARPASPRPATPSRRRGCASIPLFLPMRHGPAAAAASGSCMGSGGPNHGTVLRRARRNRATRRRVGQSRLLSASHDTWVLRPDLSMTQRSFFLCFFLRSVFFFKGGSGNSLSAKGRGGQILLPTISDPGTSCPSAFC